MPLPSPKMSDMMSVFTTPETTVQQAVKGTVGIDMPPGPASTLSGVAGNEDENGDDNGGGNGFPLPLPCIFGFEPWCKKEKGAMSGAGPFDIAEMLVPMNMPELPGEGAREMTAPEEVSEISPFEEEIGEEVGGEAEEVGGEAEEEKIPEMMTASKPEIGGEGKGLLL